jgi:hypothetical protein
MELALSLIGKVLDLWIAHESNKYRDEYLALHKEFYEEKNKERPDMAVLDHLEFRIQLLGRAVVSAETGKQAPQNPS